VSVVKGVKKCVVVDGEGLVSVLVDNVRPSPRERASREKE
jgi:hypothetical protein